MRNEALFLLLGPPMKLGTVTDLETEGCSDILMEDIPLGKTGEIL